MAKIESAFITGAASGIGRALAHALAARGAALYLTDVNEEGLSLVKAELGQANVHIEKLDVSNRDAVYSAVNRAEKALGGLDFIANNAGVSLSDTVNHMTYDDLEWVMNINFYGVVHGTKAALGGMVERGYGHIVNISSLFGLIGVPGQSAYCAAKHAVKGFNESLFYELQDTGVQVHSVHPGGVDTGIVVNGKHIHNLDGDTGTDTVQASFKQLAITTPEEAANVILRGVDRGDYRILIGRDARMADRFQRWMPNRWRHIFWKKMQTKDGKSPF